MDVFDCTKCKGNHERTITLVLLKVVRNKKFPVSAMLTFSWPRLTVMCYNGPVYVGSLLLFFSPFEWVVPKIRFGRCSLPGFQFGKNTHTTQRRIPTFHRNREERERERERDDGGFLNRERELRRKRESKFTLHLMHCAIVCLCVCA